MDENLEFHIKVLVLQYLSHIVLVCIWKQQQKTFSLLSNRFHTLKFTWIKSATFWMVSVKELLVNLLLQYFNGTQTVKYVDPHAPLWVHHTFVLPAWNLFLLFCQWQRPTCLFMRIRIECHMSRFVLYELFVSRLYLSVLHQLHDLSLLFGYTFSPLSPSGMHWTFCLQPRWGYGCDRWGQSQPPCCCHQWVFILIWFLKHRMYWGHMDIQDKSDFIM